MEQTLDAQINVMAVGPQGTAKSTFIDLTIASHLRVRSKDVPSAKTRQDASETIYAVLSSQRREVRACWWGWWAGSGEGEGKGGSSCLSLIPA